MSASGMPATLTGYIITSEEALASLAQKAEEAALLSAAQHGQQTEMLSDIIAQNNALSGQINNLETAFEQLFQGKGAAVFLAIAVFAALLAVLALLVAFAICVRRSAKVQSERERIREDQSQNAQHAMETIRESLSGVVERLSGMEQALAQLQTARPEQATAYAPPASVNLLDNTLNMLLKDVNGRLGTTAQGVSIWMRSQQATGLRLMGLSYNSESMMAIGGDVTFDETTASSPALACYPDGGRAWMFPCMTVFSRSNDPSRYFDGASMGARIGKVEAFAVLRRGDDGKWKLEKPGRVVCVP